MLTLRLANHSLYLNVRLIIILRCEEVSPKKFLGQLFCFLGNCDDVRHCKRLRQVERRSRSHNRKLSLRISPLIIGKSHLCLLYISRPTDRLLFVSECVVAQAICNHDFPRARWIEPHASLEWVGERQSTRHQVRKILPASSWRCIPSDPQRSRILMVKESTGSPSELLNESNHR